ncbi:MAG: mucoidy inhibitor MuiA family protein [Maritimibacter sp.]|uniref:mucoidy inhibitor MuiA family protein n=1 Tax=Maritimibacter sp. TaxID=2003363 RepID=UPI001D3D48F6|nr:mucoidy inhibitor MuiA family protein [Maritimibacter sp.]MBL6427263.1 mucoidy inhibitor MuiA family protein [Maritimibacter sp.]
MRATVSLIALIAAVPAQADTFFAQAPVAEAIIYPDGATLTLRAELDLPAGEHVVMVPYPEADGMGSLPRIAVSEGVVVGALGFRRDVVSDARDLYTEAQEEAAARIDRAEQALEAKMDEIEVARVDLAALQAKADYLAAITPPAEATAEEILAIADLVATQTAETRAALLVAKAALRPLEEELSDLKGDLAAAQAALTRLSPPTTENDMLTVEVVVAEAGPVALEMTEQSWAAGWRVDYDMNLDREAGEITMDRKLIVTQDDRRAWTDVALTLSTARPNDRIAPSEVYPDMADIFDPEERRPIPMAPRAEMEMADEDMAVAGIVAEPAPMKTAGLQIDGLAVSYVYPDPVSIAPGEAAELALDTLTIPADVTIEAAPRWDETAFLMAEFTNETGEPILPGEASLMRDGHFVGRMAIPMIPAGGDEELAFGPMESIRLDTILKRNAEGDAGIINRSSTRVQDITFTVENLSDEPQEVRALFPLTFSEKEDLEVEIVALPAPDETDVDDRRGVSAWDLTLAPGETQEVEITITLDWPEGQVLSWNP